MVPKVPLIVPPRLGRKQIFLPNFVITMIRPPPGAPPTFAAFQVPLKLNKLDMRDYLWNVYGVSCRSVRSFIQQRKLVEGKPREVRRSKRKYRPRAIKKMLVDMDRPFLFPKEPEDLEAWDKKTYDAAQEDSEQTEKEKGPDKNYYAPERHRKSIAEQAKELMEGNQPWKSGAGHDDAWEDLGDFDEADEVEQDVDIKKLS